MVNKTLADYVTTIMLAAIPIIVACQDQIGVYIPTEYTLIFTVVMAILSQLASNSRVTQAVSDMGSVIDAIQEYVSQIIGTITSVSDAVDTVQEAVAASATSEEVLSMNDTVDDSQKALARVVAIVKATDAKVDAVQEAVTTTTSEQTDSLAGKMGVE